MASVEVHDADPRAAAAFLAGLEATSGIPPVDEDEQRRLTGEPPVRDPGWAWAGHLVVADGVTVGYAGVRTPPSGIGGCAARVDLAVDRTHPDVQPVLAAALVHLRSHADASRAAGVEAWLRGASPAELATAGAQGFRERSRLHVLGADARALADAVPAAPAVPDGLELRTFDPEAPGDADAVVRLLMRAYPERAGWYADGFAVLLGSAWFRPEDLLLLRSAEPDGQLLALHWMKRRGGGVGEVYNLAVDPDAQGHGLGPPMLDAGLAHLVAVGCREVVLWVDAANPRAIALYRSRGFTHRWDDVSLVG